MSSNRDSPVLLCFFAYVTSFIQLVRKVAKNAIVMW